MHLPWGKIAIGILIAGVSFAGGLWALNLLWPSPKDQRPALVEVPPLKPIARNSVIVTPAAIALSAIHSALETAAPRNLAGKRDNPLPQLLSNAEIDWTVARSPLAVSGRPDALVVSTALSGTFRATGQISGDAGNLAGALGGLLGGPLFPVGRGLTAKRHDAIFDAHGDVTGLHRRLPSQLGNHVALQFGVGLFNRRGAQAGASLRLNRDQIFHVPDSRRGPRLASGFFFLGPGAHGAAQRHLAAFHFDGDALGVELGTALECLLDLFLELRG